MSIWRYLWWSIRGRCLVCGAPRESSETTRCIHHVEALP